MKTIAFITVMLFSLTCYAQTMTEKYNSLMNRYEYFNAQGQMVGYKSYDSLMKQWNYYEVTQPKQPQNTYVEPINLDYVNKALSTKQAKLDANVAKIDNAVNDIGTKIQNLEIDSDIKEIVMYTFQNALKTINSRKLDYSNNNTTREVLNYLYKQVNDEIALQVKNKQELATTAKTNVSFQTANTTSSKAAEQKVDEERQQAMAAMSKFYGGYTTALVTEEVYNYNTKLYDIISEDKTTTKFFFEDSHLYFLRSRNNQWLSSAWVWFITEPKFYILFDSYSQLIAVDKDFSKFTWYADKVGDVYTKRYVYHNLKKDTT
ncbi:MAG: hypothetical protein EOO43_01445, partial [Flavobacterium sp.]